MQDTDWRPSPCPICGKMRAASEFPICRDCDIAADPVKETPIKVVGLRQDEFLGSLVEFELEFFPIGPITDLNAYNEGVEPFDDEEDEEHEAELSALREELVQMKARAEAAEAEAARLSTPPDDAEVRAWVETLTETAESHDDAYNDSGHLMDKALAEEARGASAFITRLSHALAAERKLADDAKRLLEMAQDRCGHNFVGAEYPTFVDFCDAHEARRKAETLAKHGSKT